MEEDSQQTGHLDEPAHVIGVHPVLDGPLRQLVPLVSGAAVDGQTQLRVLVFALLQVKHHLLQLQSGTGPPGMRRWRRSLNSHGHPGLKRQANTHLDDVCKVFSLDVVVGLDEDLSEDGLSYWVVLGVELVKPVERVAVLVFLGGM